MMSDKRYSKVEEEIIQILDQMDQDTQPDPPANLVPFRPRPKTRRFTPARVIPRDTQILGRIRRYSAGSWLGVGIVAALLAWQLSRLSPILGMIAMVASIAAFLAALYTRRAGSVAGIPSASSTTKRWRGRDIDMSGNRQHTWQSRDGWWRGRFRGPRR